MALPKWTEIGLFIGGIYRKEHKLYRLCENTMQKSSNLFDCCFFTVVQVDIVRIKERQKVSRKTGNRIGYISGHRTVKKKNNCIIIFAAEFFCVGCPHMMGGDSARQSVRYWGDQSLCDTMVITGIVGDRRMCYLIVQLHMPPPRSKNAHQIFMSPFPLSRPIIRHT